MEYVSILAGEPFSDRPACVDPLLARLAWAVNDAAEDEVRAHLAGLAPRFIGTATSDPLVAPSIVVACCRYRGGPDGCGSSGMLARAQHRAETRLRRLRARPEGRRRCSDRLYRMHAEMPVQEAVRLSRADPEALRRLLAAALDAVTGVVQEVATRRSGSPTPVA